MPKCTEVLQCDWMIRYWLKEEVEQDSLEWINNGIKRQHHIKEAVEMFLEAVYMYVAVL